MAVIINVVIATTAIVLMMLRYRAYGTIMMVRSITVALRFTMARVTIAPRNDTIHAMPARLASDVEIQRRAMLQGNMQRHTEHEYRGQEPSARYVSHVFHVGERIRIIGEAVKKSLAFCSRPSQEKTKFWSCTEFMPVSGTQDAAKSASPPRHLSLERVLRLMPTLPRISISLEENTHLYAHEAGRSPWNFENPPNHASKSKPARRCRFSCCSKIGHSIRNLPRLHSQNVHRKLLPS